MSDDRQHAPATARNREPILAVLRDLLPVHGMVLEIASGTGEHAVHFAAAFAGLSWQPSDPSPAARRSIEAWARAQRMANVLAPLDLDAAAPDWPVAGADAIVCINMIHISPWAATEGLLRGAGRILPPGGVLYLYGPFRRSDRPLEPSNEAFDADLRRRDPEWGLRELDAVANCAASNGLAVRSVVEMPANNLSVVFARLDDSAN